MIDVIIKHGLKYFSATLISSLIALLMTKYYTMVFNPAEFGVLALYLVMFKYIATLVSLNMDGSSTRLYFDYRETRRDEYLSTIFWFITMMAMLVLVIGLSVMPIVVAWISPGTQWVYLVTLISGIGSVYVSFLMRILYNEQRSTSVFKHTLFQTFVNHLSSVILISVWHGGILGRISGQGVGYFLNVFTLLKEFSKKNLFRLRLHFNQKMAKETFLLALPTMIASLQTVVFIYLDRIFIKHYIGDSAVGIYSLGYILGQGLSMVNNAISQAILPKVYNGMNADYEAAKQELESFSYKYYAGLILITVTLSLLSPFLVELLSNENYHEAALVMPFIMAGFMMGGLYKVASLLLGYHKVVWFYPVLALVSFGLNAVLNWWLIPLYGIMGSSLASFLGLFVYSAVVQTVSFNYLSSKYRMIVTVAYVMILAVVLYLFSGVESV